MNLIFFLIPAIVLLIIVIFFLLHIRNKNQINYGTVIILNGSLNSDKTKIQKALQELMLPELWIRLGFESLLKEIYSDIDDIELLQNKDKKDIIKFLMSNNGKKVVSGLNAAIAGYLKAGNNVIVDYVAYDVDLMVDFFEGLVGIEGYQFKAETVLNFSDDQDDLSKYHKYIMYDLDLDLTKNPNEIAIEIKNFIHKARFNRQNKVEK